MGKLPGGFIQVSILNSLLQRNWIHPVDFPILFLFMGCLGGLALATTLRPSQFFRAFSAAVAMEILGGLSAFAYYSLATPWYFMTFGTVCSGFFVFVDKARRREEYSQRMQLALEGMIAQDKIDTLLKDTTEVPNFEVSEQVITLMFVDIVDFSKFAEEKSPKAVFSALRELMAELSDLVHSYGGIVDKSLGDGLLCYFGYQYGPNQDKVNSHADQAISCAIEIQRRHLKRCLEGHAETDIIHPLRIGINSAGVFIGDLGGKQRVDFTIIGHGVNYAQRFEAACDPFKIMYGPTTKDLCLSYHRSKDSVVERQIPIKNRRETFAAFELDPFRDDQDLVGQAIARYRKTLGIERRDVRWPVVPGGLIQVNTDFGTGRLVDFSACGIAIELPVYLAKGVTFTMTFQTEAGSALNYSQSDGEVSLIGQVRWGRKSDQGCIHGIFIENGNHNERNKFVNAFREVLQQNRVYLDPTQIAS